MKIIGITGGAGAGKSEALGYLEKTYGAKICKADDVARNLQRKGTICFRRIVERFGEEILDERGRLDRKALAARVFADPGELKALNAIVHPAVKEKIREMIRKEEKGGGRLFILEAALLIEEHYDEICGELWYIYADEETRRKRLMASRGYSKERIDGLFAAQLSSKSFFDRCAHAIDNSHSFEEAQEQIDALMEKEGFEKLKEQVGQNE